MFRLAFNEFCMRTEVSTGKYGGVCLGVCVCICRGTVRPLQLCLGI